MTSILIMQSFSGLSLVSVLLLMSLGLAIIFGLMGVINMAHGELMTIGAYITYLTSLGFSRYLPSALPHLFLRRPVSLIRGHSADRVPAGAFHDQAPVRKAPGYPSGHVGSQSAPAAVVPIPVRGAGGELSKSRRMTSGGTSSDGDGGNSPNRHRGHDPLRGGDILSVLCAPQHKLGIEDEGGHPDSGDERGRGNRLPGGWTVSRSRSDRGSPVLRGARSPSWDRPARWRDSSISWIPSWWWS